MEIKNFIPDDLLLKKNKLESRIAEHDKEQEKANKYSNASSMFVSILVTIFSIIIPAPAIFSSLLAKFQGKMNFLRILEIVAQIGSLVGILIIFIVAIFRMITYRKYKKTKHNLMAELTKDISETMKYTGIIVIADCANPNDVRLFLGNHEDEDMHYFLPYIHMDANLSITDQKVLVNNHLIRSLKISEADIVKIENKNDRPFFSIKPTSWSGTLEEHAFVFFEVQFNYNVKRFLKSKFPTSWATLSEMKNNPKAMAYNKDIISWMEERMNTVKDSFITIEHPLKIIWNMTLDCHYNCDICATKDPARKELEYQQKIAVLNHLAPLKARIAKIDFSGGDPCINEENLSIIQTAINMFGASKIAVTTTGYGLARACSLRDYDAIQRSEITIDAIKKSDAPVRHATDIIYCEDNIRSVIENINHIVELTINVPIISPVLESGDIELLINNILEIRKHKENIKVNLIRLMPVGAMATRDYPSDYLPSKSIDEIAKKLRENNIAVTIHCSLKVSKCASAFSKTAKASCCNMMNKKIGIDCAGNVFTCGWAGYLSEQKNGGQLMKPEKNPFYLGNVLQLPLDRILSEENANYLEIKSRISNSLHGKINYCPIASYSKNPQWYINADPLRK